jgi:hypothetical protein
LFTNRNIPDLGAMVCYTVNQFQDDFNSARPLWSFTNDMDNQGFYGTCFIKPRAVTFLPYPQLNTTIDNKFEFLGKCLPCDNLGQDLSTPRWGPQQRYCEDCVAKPVPPRQLTIPTWTFVGNGTFADKAHWLSPGGSPYATADECKILAARDPTCSKFVMHSQNRTTMIRNNAAAMNVNQSAGYTLWTTSSGIGRLFTNFSATFSYYRTCGCLDATTANAVAGFSPTLDSTQAMACVGVSAAGCRYKAFAVYKLA